MIAVYLFCLRASRGLALTGRAFCTIYISSTIHSIVSFFNTTFLHGETKLIIAWYKEIVMVAGLDDTVVLDGKSYDQDNIGSGAGVV